MSSRNVLWLNEEEEQSEGQNFWNTREWKEQVQLMQKEEVRLEEHLGHLDRLWATRRRHLLSELQNLRVMRAQKTSELQHLTRPAADDVQEVVVLVSGPEWLRWVDETSFTAVCSAVILLNLVTITLELWQISLAGSFWAIDQIFLIFYLIELLARWGFHRQGFLFGPLSSVVWNWLDLLIVTGGIIDQWLQPMISRTPGVHLHQGFHASGLRLFRLFRLVQVMRFLKVIKIFLLSDSSWIEGTVFQSFISGVIFLNSISLGLENDIQWDGWTWLEQTMLVIYFFELAMRVKTQSFHFFVHEDDWCWNNLDFAIVAAGIFEQWMLPVRFLIESLITGEPWVHHNCSSLLPLLRIMRLLRILRLIKLLKVFKPLHRLAVGVLQAMAEMQWVLVLTSVLLYVCAVLFTSLVGHGLIYGGEVSSDAQALFGSVPRSLMLLFRVMNGDTTVMESLLTTAPLKLLYVTFLVVSNWAVLAILTAVVSDNMITATEVHEKEEVHEQQVEHQAHCRGRLLTLFREIDKDGSGTLTRAEFDTMLADKELREELLDTASLTLEDMQDLFSFLSHHTPDGEKIEYTDFIEKLQNEGKVASQRSVYRLLKQMSICEQELEAKLDHIRTAFPASTRSTHVVDKECFYDPNRFGFDLANLELVGLTNHFVSGRMTRPNR